MSPAICFSLDQSEILSPITTHSRFLTPPKKKSLENIVGKGENAGNQHFLLFPHVLYPSQHKFLFLSHYYFVVCKCFELGVV